MKLDSFRELLIKKADGNPALQALAKYAKDEVILEQVLEVLEKMARASHKGDSANFAVRDFATEMDPETEPHMLRDAIGHHVSNYKAALKGNDQGLANKHARQAFRLMNLADVAQKHSGGKLSVDYVPPQPWERSKFNKRYDESHNLVQEGKYKPGDFTTKTKGLNYSVKGGNFDFLNNAPYEPSKEEVDKYGHDRAHPYHRELKRHGHTGGYPFEHVRVNGKYIDVADKDKPTTYEEHPFDKHPIMNVFENSVKNSTPEEHQEYLKNRDKYYNEDPHIAKYFENEAKKEAADPEKHKKRGEQPSGPVHENVKKMNLKDEQPEAEAEEAASEEAPKKEEVPANHVSLDDPRIPEELRAILKGGKK